MFGSELMGRLACHIANSGTVRAVATLKRFAAGQPVGFREVSSETCETSWTVPVCGDHGVGEKHPGCPVFVYLRDGNDDDDVTR